MRLSFEYLALAVVTALRGVVLAAPESNSFPAEDLHILPLGASITYGLHSSTGDGYREDLRQLLSPANVTFIGQKCSGSMKNGNNEGHPGFVIEQMRGVVEADIQYNPNVILIYVGTNDLLFSSGEESAATHMIDLVSYLTTQLPDSLIVVGDLFLIARPGFETRTKTFNEDISSLTDLGNVMIANLSDALDASDLGPDGVHPNDTGYSKMASVFYDVLSTAQKDDRIPAAKQFTTPLRVCKPVTAASKATGHSTSNSTSNRTSSSNHKSGARHEYSMSFSFILASMLGLVFLT